MRFLIPFLLLANIASAAEVPLPNAPAGPAAARHLKLAAASNGHGFLVVSREYRERFGIFGMRADDRGRPVDPAMFRIADDASDEPLDIASDGDSYLVAWCTYGTALHLARVDDQGHVTPCGELPNAALLSMAWGGSAYVVAYADRADKSTNVAVIASDGTMLRSRVPIITGNFNQSSLRLSTGASGTVIATWTSNDNAVQATTVHTAALRDGTYVAPVSTGQQQNPLTVLSPASVATNGNQSLVAWAETTYPFQPVPNAISTKFRARRLDANGNPTGSVFDLGNRNLEFTFGEVAVAWNGTSFIVGYAMPYEPGSTLLSISPDDHVTTLYDVTSPNYELPLMALAGSDRGGLFVWNDGQLHGAFVDSAFGTPRLFSLAAASQINPSIAWCGDAYRAVWSEVTDRGRVQFRRVGVDGIPVGESIAIRESSLFQFTPKIACSASNALVAWSEYDFVANAYTQRAAAIDPDGTSHAPIELGPSFYGGSTVLWNGSEYLVVWELSQQIALLRISREGQPIDATPRLLPVDGLSESHLGVSIAWNGSEYLLAWAGNVMRLTPLLTPIGSARAVPGADPRAPIAIAGNGEWLVAWSEGANGKFARLSSSLDELERGSIDGHPSDGAFTGSGYRIVTEDSAISHGAVIHKRVTSELLWRLYISLDSGRVRASRR